MMVRHARLRGKYPIPVLLDIVEHERVHRAFIGNEIEVAVDAFLGGMEEAVVAHGVDDPEVLVAGGDLQNLFGAGKLDQRGIPHLGVDADDVVAVVLDQAGSLLAVGHGRSKAKQERDDRCSRAHENLL